MRRRIARPPTACSAGVPACEFWRRPAAIPLPKIPLTIRDLPSTAERSRKLAGDNVPGNTINKHRRGATAEKPANPIDLCLWPLRHNPLSHNVPKTIQAYSCLFKPVQGGWEGVPHSMFGVRRSAFDVPPPWTRRTASHAVQSKNCSTAPPEIGVRQRLFHQSIYPKIHSSNRPSRARSCPIVQGNHPKPQLDGTRMLNLISPARWMAESTARPNIFSDLTELTERFVL